MATADPSAPQLTIDGSQELPVESFDLRESLSEVPLYSVSVSHDEDTLDTFIGKPAVLSFDEETSSGVTPRTFAGLIMSAERTLDGDARPILTFTLQPTLAVLGLSKSSAMYQKMSAVDIAEAVLKRNGLSREPISKPSAREKRETVIQYNENDLDFVRRILADEGLAFYYHNGQSPTTLMIHDVQKPFPKGTDAIKFTDARLGDVTLEQASSLTIRRSLRPDKVSLATYDPDQAAQVSAGPSTSSAAKTAQTPTVTEFRMTPVGKLTGNEIKVIAAAEQRPESDLIATSEHPAMYIGQEIEVISDAAAEFEGRYTVVGLHYTPVRGNSLKCDFTAAPVDLVPAPTRLPKPLISGVHNAKVVGASASAKAGEVACDAEGRVMVEFFWDGAKDASGYLRVADAFAGNGYGAQFTPRVGHEVLVSFLHGDPDSPIITGQVYTAKHKPPFATKGTTSTGIVTKLAGPTNELEFCDEAEKELLAMRAAKDFELTVAENITRTIAKLDTTKIGETAKLDVGEDLKVTVTGAHTVAADSRTSKITKSDKVDAKEISLTGSSKITLAVGSNKIEISTSGIKISGTKVEVSGATKVDVSSDATLNLSGLSAKLAADTTLNLEGLQLTAKGKAQAKVEAPIAEVSGSGVLTVKGGVVMIN